MKNKNYLIPAIAGWTILAVFAFVFISKGTWQVPTDHPPAGNLSAPLNIGSSNQTKAGNLSLSGAFNVASSATFQSSVTLTPLVDSESLFKITNATGTEFFKVNSTNNTSTLSAGGTSLALSSAGATLGDLNIAGTTMSFGIAPGYKLGIGIIPTADNLEIAGSAKATGQVKSDTGFCIGVNCITEWPSGEGGGGGGEGESVPVSGMILSTVAFNNTIMSAGYTMLDFAGMPVTIQGSGGGMPMSFYVYEKQF